MSNARTYWKRCTKTKVRSKDAKRNMSKYAREMKDIILKETGKDYLGKKKGMRKEKLNNRQDTEWVIKTKNASIGWKKKKGNADYVEKRRKPLNICIFEDCRLSKTEGIDWKEIIERKNNSLTKMKEINWKRKEKEKEMKSSKEEEIGS